MKNNICEILIPVLRQYISNAEPCGVENTIGIHRNLLHISNCGVFESTAFSAPMGTAINILWTVSSNSSAVRTYSTTHQLCSYNRTCRLPCVLLSILYCIWGKGCTGASTGMGDGWRVTGHIEPLKRNITSNLEHLGNILILNWRINIFLVEVGDLYVSS